MSKLVSAVIVSHSGKGYVAYLRFTNPRLDKFISAGSKKSTYEQIEKYMKEINE